MFDAITAERIGCYVYALLDSRSKLPFYVGKGTNNRVFNHINCALDDAIKSDKYETIRAIQDAGGTVSHVILRHGLSHNEAFLVEASIIDFLKFIGAELTNEVSGHHSYDNGLMTAEELIRKYNAPKLEKIDDPLIIININETYSRGSGAEGIYEATRASWVVDKNRIKKLKYALSEYRGIIVEAFQINYWYPVQGKDKNGIPKTRWAFNGEVADAEIRKKYTNRSVAHIKKRGASNPIRYNL
jgi:hypothetical protein